MKKYLLSAIGIFAVLSGVLTSTISAQTIDRSAEARALVSKAGSGPKAKVEVELLDGSKIKGNIESSTNDSFTVARKDSGSLHTIAFADVKSIRKPRSGLKPRTWVIIGAAAAAAIIVGKTVIYPVLCDGGAGC